MALSANPILFDEWRPDLAPLASGIETALNVLPAPDGYVAMPMPVPRGPGTAPGGVPQALYPAVSPDGVVVPLLFTDNDIWRVQSTTWAHVGRTPNYTGLVPWSVTTWGDIVLAVNGKDSLQFYQIGGSGFGDILETGLDYLTAAYVAVVGNFVVLADVREAQAETRYPDRVRWSGFQRPLSYVVSQATQAAYMDRPNIGTIKGLVGGEFGLILGERGMDRMDYIGPPSIWQFSNLETDIGTLAPRSVVKAGNMVFWLSPRGWRMSQGGPSSPIGHGKVDEWTLERLDPDKLDLMSVTPLYHEQAILWAFVSRDSPDGSPDEVLAYSWIEQRWTRGKMSVTILGRAASPDIFTDDDAPPGLALLTDDDDLLTDSFGDSSVYPAALAANGLQLIQATDGVVCELTTTEQQLLPGRRTKITRIFPIVHGAGNGLWAYVDTRDDQRIVATTRGGPYEPEDTDGSVACNDAGRFHRFTINVRTPFDKAIGVQVAEQQDTGRR
jgi:hypothetical protein